MNLFAIFGVFLVICSVFTSASPAQVNKKKKQCGKSLRLTGSVIGGKPTIYNSFPWLVAFRLRATNKFFCGGSLVSEKHIVSAAHCFHNKRVKIATVSQEVLAFIGKHDLNQVDEEGSVPHDINDLILHEDWDPKSDDFDADISLVVLETEVDLKNREKVRLVCLPPASEFPVTGIGRVVGWGISERSIADGEIYDSKPNELELPAVTRDQCTEADIYLDIASSDRTFCAGFVNQNKSACKGDSGGGFYLYENAKRIFNLAGIVSASLTDPYGDCRTDIYSIFTDVTKYVDWIESKMKETIEIRWTEVEFECREFRGTLSCSRKFKNSISQNMKILFSGKRPASHYVLEIYFAPSKFIFDGIGENFPNLEKLRIDDQEIKFVERKNFKNLQNLEKLWLDGNQIEFLPEDVFSDLPNLIELSLNNNLLRTLPSKIFNHLRKLEKIELRKNKIENLPYDLFSRNLKLEAVYTHHNSRKKFDVDYSRVPDVKLFNETWDFYYQRGEIRFVE